LFWPFLDALSIIPVLIFHHQNFKDFETEELDQWENDYFVPIGGNYQAATGLTA
jgi:hypothetical protein